MDHQPQSNETIKNRRQFLVALSANLASTTVGICLSWSSPSSVLLSNPDTPLEKPLNSDQLGWVTSLNSLGAIIGSFIVWLLLDRIGRKWSLLTSSLTFFISTVLLISVHKIWAIYVARIFHGITVGIVMSAQPIYNGEISTDNLRGAVGILMTINLLIPAVLLMTVGTLVGYVIVQWICLPFCIIFPITFIFMPETPYYYISKGEYEKAIESLKFLRGQKSEINISNEYEKIKKTVEESFENKKSFFDLFKIKANLKALIITVGLIILQQLSGGSVVFYYTESIILSTKSITPFVLILSNSLFQFTGIFISIILMDKFGRKTLILVSALLMSISLIGLGTYFVILKHTEDDINYIKWLPFASLCLYSFGFSIGYTSVPWILVGELFSASVKSFAASITVCACWIFSFIISKLFPLLNDSYGLDFIMFLLGSFSIISCIFIIFMVFETKGMSFDEIQKRLSKKK